MNRDMIIDQINRYELRIRDLEEENRILSDKIQRVEETQRGCNKNRESLDAYFEHESHQSNKARYASHIKAAASYADSLDSACYEYSIRAHEDFDEITRLLRREKTNLTDEVESNRAQIRNLRDEIAYLRQRLNNLPLEV